MEAKTTTRQLFVKEKVEILTLDELKRTVNAKDMGYSSRTRPVSHFQFIEDILTILKKNKHSPELDHIYCSKSSGTKLIPKIEKEMDLFQALEAFLLDKVTGKIILKQLSTNNTELSGCIAFSYHEKGLDLAFGSHVWDCANMSIFGDNVMHTYGSKRDVSYPRMLEVFSDWCKNLETMHKRDQAIIETMKRMTVTGAEMLRFIGKLLVRAVEANMGMKVVAPLNVTQVGEITRGIVNLKGEKFYEGSNCTLWEFYNFMTAVLKGSKTDITTLITDNVAIGNLMVEEYNVEPTIDVVDLNED